MALHKTYIALDIGSTQITCIAGDVSNTGGVNVSAITVQESSGIAKGMIMDMQQAVHCIKSVIETTEKKLGQNIHNVTVSSSGLKPKSHWVTEEVSISDKKVKDLDVKKLLNQCKKKVATEETPVIHVTPYYYSIDGVEAKNPIGIVGKTLKVNIHMTTCQQSSLENLKALLDMCSLTADDIVVDSLASALGTLDSEEKDMSCMVLDIGGGSSSWAIFYNGSFVSAGSINLGGNHITSDIMKTISATSAGAERIKIKHGSAIIPNMTSTTGPIEYHRVGEQDSTPYTISGETIATIINNRLDEIFNAINVEITKFSFAKRLILTGGTADMTNIREMATTKLKRNVRIAKPIHTLGLHMFDKPMASTAIGLLRYAAQDRPKEEKIIIKKTEIYEGNLFSRIFKWLKTEI